MTLIEQELATYLSELASSGRKALFLFFPNFEERSVAAAENISILAEGCEAVQAMVFTLQGRHRPEILDEIKFANSRRVAEAFTNKRVSMTSHKLQYPHPPPSHFQEAVRDSISNLGPDADLILDISAIPRDLLFHLFDFLFPVTGAYPFVIQGTRVHRIMFLYSWAAAYPRSYGPELLGDLKGYFLDQSLESFTEKRDKVRLVLACAGTGHDATGAIKISDRPHGWTHDVFLFVNKNNLVQSYKQMMCHQSLMKTLRERNESFRCVFSVEQFSAELDRIVSSAIEAHREGANAFVVGPFGPKPFGLCGFLAAWKYRRAFNASTNHRNRAEILNLSSGQYLSIYSIGVGQIDFYEASFDP